MKSSSRPAPDRVTAGQDSRRNTEIPLRNVAQQGYASCLAVSPIIFFRKRKKKMVGLGGIRRETANYRKQRSPENHPEDRRCCRRADKRVPETPTVAEKRPRPSTPCQVIRRRLLHYYYHRGHDNYYNRWIIFPSSSSYIV